MFFASTFTAAFIGFFTFFCGGTAQPKQRNKENYVEKIALVPARTRPKFCHILLLVQTPNPLVQALETKKKNKLFNETNLSPTFFC